MPYCTPSNLSCPLVHEPLFPSPWRCHWCQECRAAIIKQVINALHSKMGCKNTRPGVNTGVMPPPPPPNSRPHSHLQLMHFPLPLLQCRRAVLQLGLTLTAEVPVGTVEKERQREAHMVYISTLAMYVHTSASIGATMFIITHTTRVV